MKKDELRAEILRLYHTEAWPVGTIASSLGVHPDVVSGVLKSEGLPHIRAERTSIIDPFIPFIRETLETYPHLQGQRLYDMCVDRGYPGGPDHFRHLVRSLRPKPKHEPFARLAKIPAEESQMDWGHFGRLSIGRARRQLVAFVMVLSWSRMIFVRFFLGTPMECLLRGHVSAFEFFGGVSRKVIYDNMKSAVIERRGSAVRFHPTLLELAEHYRFQPRAAEVRRPTDKGRVERAIRFVRGSFFAGRKWRDLDDLNAQAQQWCLGRAAARPRARDDQRTVAEAFDEERSRLLALPPTLFPAERIAQAKIGKTPIVRFDGNDYSVPIELVHETVSIAATETRVRILKGGEEVCEHTRSYDKGELVEDPEHTDELGDLKRKMRKGRIKDRLVRSAPSAAELFGVLASRGASIAAASKSLSRLLSEHGSERLEAAIAEALARETPEPSSVKLILERRRHEAGQPPRVAVQLPDDPRVRDLAVRPATLEQYGDLRPGQNDGKEQRDGQS